MRIGSQRGIFTLRRRVQVGVTASNEPNFIWQDWRPDIFCEVSVKRGKEQFDPIAKKRYSEEVWQFRTRYDEIVGIDATMKIAHEGNSFDIKAIMPDGQRHWDCLIEATVTDGALGGPALTIAITSFIDLGVVGSAYQLQIEASGGAAPYQFDVASGSVPGLEIDGAGLISGTPTTAGSFPLSIQVTDSTGATETLPSFEIVVEAA